MKITALKAIPVRVPRPQPFTSSLGVSPSSENAVIEIHTDEGLVGLGEASSIWDRKGRGEADEINGLLAGALIGQDPFRINELSALMNRLLHRAFPAKAGVEMALYDLVGKALDTPVYNLLGGPVRDRVLLSHSLSMGSPEQVLEQALRLAAKGYQTLKLKVGRNQLADLRAMEALRTHLGADFTLRVDANMGWPSAKEAVRHIRELEPFGLELVEQPLHSADLEGLRFVREQVGVPIMLDESVWTPADALACVRAGAADVFNVYVAEAGGLGPASQIFALAESARLGCIIGSMPELGVGTAAQAHLAFAMRNLGYASDVNGVVYHQGDVVRERLRIEEGYLYPPAGPGLGVSLDPEQLAKYRIDRG
ncbi:MAG: mandelate racemase/muconate lactonizing enzyme family protein [Candidatus Handelsmanbacteria bacterium]|nr:mandelate racemase/muconate lactonizing enzyme family protein [Candidatus Handelsmanbacteria bacterium]